jgi:hypothetical protein
LLFSRFQSKVITLRAKSSQPATAKQVEKHSAYLLKMFRTLTPFHRYGRSPEAIPLVEARMDLLSSQYKREHPDASKSDLQRMQIAFLCRAREELFNALTAAEKKLWRERAEAASDDYEDDDE